MKKEEKKDVKIRDRAVGFLVWFRNQYKSSTSDTFKEMAKKYGQGNYGTCRNLIIELVNAGYLTLWQSYKGRRRYYLNMVKYNELVNPCIFHKNDPRLKEFMQIQKQIVEKFKPVEELPDSDDMYQKIIQDDNQVSISEV